MKKRVLSLLLVMLMVMSLVPISALAEETDVIASGYCGADGDGGNIVWKLYADGTLEIDGVGEMESYYYTSIEPLVVNTPWIISGYSSRITNVEMSGGISTISNCAFTNCDNLERVNISESVTSIGSMAFYGCKRLTNINIPRAVTYIGMSAFYGCRALAGVLIPENVVNIADCTFQNCTSLKSVKIQDGVTRIGNNAFSGCMSLTDIDIPGSVTNVSDTAFSGCMSLTSVNVEQANTAYSSEAGVLFNKDKTTVVIYPKGKTDTQYAIPKGVTAIPSWVFSGCTSLTNIDIPDSVTSIGDDAFRGCTSLASINVEQDNAVYSSEEGVLFNKAKTNLMAYPTGNKRTEYCIPDGVKYVVDTAFRGGSYLKSITIPVSVERFWETTFNDLDNLKTIYYEGTLEQFNAIDMSDSLISGSASLIPADIHCTDGIIHHYDDATVPPTCTTTGYTHHVCKYCNDSYDDDIKAELGHNFVDGKCKRCGVSESTVTPPHTHDYKAVVTAPTCTEQGYTTYTCSCGDSYKSDYKDALGHDYKNGTCTRCGAKDPSVTPPHTHDYKSVVTKPTCTEQGYTTYTCSCGDSYKGSYVDPLGHDYKNGTCTRCGVKDPNYKPQANFTDVAAGSYCYDAVQWAVANGITNGTDATHFSPNAGCTRGQVVTFLWRAAGEPVVGGNVGFVDVAPGSYCYEAVKWAVANGITKGTDATHFSPKATCTRGQVVTFMYRAEGEPAVGGSNGFVDVAPGSYCYNAVQWAVANGITKGTDATHFSPNATCTRGQVVTFLYRAQ